MNMNIDPILGLELRSPVKFVMTVLTFRAFDDDHEAHMTIGKLVEQTGLSKRTIQGAIHELEDLGLVIARRGWGKGAYNIYTISVQKVQELHPYGNISPQTDQLKGAGAAPKKASYPQKGAGAAPQNTEKNLPKSKGAAHDLKGAAHDLKGAAPALKGAAPAPNKTIKIKNKTRARGRAREEMPPRTGPNGPVAKENGESDAPVNGAPKGRTGREVYKSNGKQKKKLKQTRIEFHSSASDEARELWSKCLQVKTDGFGITDCALFGNIRAGQAVLHGISPVASTYVETQKENIEWLLESLTGEPVELVMIAKEGAEHA